MTGEDRNEQGNSWSRSLLRCSKAGVLVLCSGFITRAWIRCATQAPSTKGHQEREGGYLGEKRCRFTMRFAHVSFVGRDATKSGREIEHGTRRKRERERERGRKRERENGRERDGDTATQRLRLATAFRPAVLTLRLIVQALPVRHCAPRDTFLSWLNLPRVVVPRRPLGGGPPGDRRVWERERGRERLYTGKKKERDGEKSPRYTKSVEARARDPFSRRRRRW